MITNRLSKALIRRPTETVSGSLVSLALQAIALITSLDHIDVRAEIQFARDIQPILSDHCYTCHGPDAQQRKADFRLDLKEEAFRDLDGYRAIVAGQPAESELLRRISTKDAGDIMPPPDAKLDLSESEKALLRQWITEGATWEEHWAFRVPTCPSLPSLSSKSDEEQVRNPIDRFVLARLNQHGELEPSPPAAPERLLRRVTLDLTGLPPTLDELDEFLGDSAPNRYERAVDRLLNSSAHAERMALDWMDVSRYADSHGMHADGWRMMWPWRDWVIKAFQDNQPYDQFVTWQLAGDLLPNPTDEQIIATAFHRNHAMTAEGGVVDEEFRLQYVFDRVQTTATAFLGLTFECSRCHDHKFDPIAQKDYYRLSAFFNNLKELGMTGDDGNYGPMHLLKTPAQKAQLATLQSRIEALEQQATKRFTATTEATDPDDLTVPQPDAHFPFDKISLVGEKKTKRLDANEHTSLSGKPELEAGHQGQAIRFDSEYDIVSIAKTGLYDSSDSFTVSLWAKHDEGGKLQSLIGNAGGKNNYWRGWDFHLDESDRLTIKLTHALPHSYLHVCTVAPVSPGVWSQLTLTYDGSSQAAGVRLFVNGQPQATEIINDRLTKTIYPVSGNANRDREDRALRVGKAYRSFTGEYGIYSGLIDNIQLWNHALTDAEIAALYHEQRSPDHPTFSLPTETLSAHHVQRSDPEYRRIHDELKNLYRERQQILDRIPELMVMEELPSPRQTFVLRRGQYDAPTDEVQPSTPASILPYPAEFPKNRLGLARWLFHEQNPLTARVTVNRYWQLFFGRGLVETSEDFGKQGSRPTHPDLLDWLAIEFRESGWDLNHLQRLIVTSATYRQSSDTATETLRRDPLNDYLSRGPRHRLQAEFIRDQALVASGLLVPVLGGPSVKPFQPEGLWIDKGNFSAKLLRYKPDSGSKRYRRSLYTFVRRTSPHPAMVAFDAPNRDVCQVRRESTNTPLQALVLMNDPQFVEAARAFAVRIQRQAGEKLSEQINYAFRTVTSRRPSPEEVSVLMTLVAEETQRLKDDPTATEALLDTKEQALSADLDPVKTAALTILANTLLNHDESYTKR